VNLLAWINVAIAAIIMVATLPGRTQGLGLITEPMLRDLQLDRVAYAHINLWATLLGAIACIPVGRLVDRIGLRLTTVITTLLLSAVVLQMSQLAGSILALFLLILATRALGQSALSVTSITVVGKSFDRGVAAASGVYSMMLSVMFAGAFTLVGSIVRESGWRTAWSSVALALAAVVAPLVLFCLREPKATPSKQSDDAALKTPAFWVFGGATAAYGLVSSGLGLFNEAVLAERGFSQQTYHQVLAGTALLALVGQLGCGLLTLRLPMQHLMAAALFIYGLALAMLPFLSTLTQLWTFAAMVGLSGGMITVMFFAVWRRAYGAGQLGRIQGAAQMLTVLASAVGPLIFAQSAAWTGSYMPVLWLLGPLVALLGFAALRVSLPQLS
jgi:MFS family permease